jgi:hypothetical protein
MHRVWLGYDPAEDRMSAETRRLDGNEDGVRWLALLIGQRLLLIEPGIELHYGLCMVSVRIVEGLLPEWLAFSPTLGRRTL